MEKEEPRLPLSSPTTIDLLAQDPDKQGLY